MLADFFSSLLDERRERGIRHRTPNYPLQPGSHQIFAQWGSVQTGLDVKSRLAADDPDYGGGILIVWKQFLRLKLTERAVEASVWFDRRSDFRQVAERTMHRTTIDRAGGGFNRLKVTERVL